MRRTGWFGTGKTHGQPARLAAALALFCIPAPALGQSASAPPPTDCEVSGADARAPGCPMPDPPAESAAGAAPKESFLQRFIDNEDKGFDFSDFMGGGGFVPIPIVITEPAVDNGFGLAAAFLYPDPERPRDVTKTIVGAFKTGNGSQGIGFFRGGYALDGRLAYRAGVGHGRVTLETFPAFAPEGIQYTSKYDYGIFGGALWRFGDSGISAGPLFDFRKLTTTIDGLPVPDQFADDAGVTLKTGALGLGVHFDNRDNPLTPRRGTNLFVEAKFNRGAFGSDRDYEVYDAYLFTFDRFSDRLRYGLKVEFDAVRGDFPFFYAPAIDLRGVQAAEFQGENVISTELEITWQLTRRWSLLAFGGLGATDAGDRRIFRDSGEQWAGGAGFRYLLARKIGFEAGMDFAYGPGGFVFYLQFGHAWSLKMD